MEDYGKFLEMVNEIKNIAVTQGGKLTKEEMGEIKGGYYSCPRSKGEFTRTYNALNKTQKKEYIKYCYEHNCTKYFN